ncbi:hypothetical protein QVL82_06410 [Cellulosimicrobium funkei]|uniref:hypothetical protein n=1 Tax=Cellulosimicrobium funkei TaxID=264251 RepID=UPI0037574465
MAVFLNTAESGAAPGTPITSLAQTGGTAGTAFETSGSFNQNAGGVSFSAEGAAHGALCYALGIGTTATLGRHFGWTGRLSTQVAYRWYSRVSALGSAGSLGIFQASAGREGNGNYSPLLGLVRQADGTVQVVRGLSRAVVFTSAPIDAGVLYRYEARIKYATAAGAANGVEEFAIFAGDSPEPLPGCYWIDTAVANFVADMLPGARQLFGGTADAGQTYYAHTHYLDDVAMATGADAAAFIGPVLPAPVSTARPYVVTDNAGRWFARGGSDLVTVVSDGVPETLIESPGVEPDESITYALPPLTSGALRIGVDANRGTSTSSMRVELLQGATTVIASRTFALGAAEAHFELNCTQAELAAITDRSKLRVRVTGNPS